MRGWVALVMSAGLSLSASLEMMGRGLGFVMGFVRARCRRSRASLRSISRRSAQAAEPFVSKLFPRSTKLLRTEPLAAMVIGAFVRGLSMRDIEALCEEAGLGSLSKATASRICEELRERFEHFKRRDLYGVQLVALFLDAVFLPVRPDGPKEGVLVAWGFTEDGERVLLAVMLGMRESHEDWLELGRDLIARGLGAPLLVVADGAPGLIKAVEQCWPARRPPALRRSPPPQPAGQAPRAQTATGSAATTGTRSMTRSATRDGRQRLQALVDELDHAGYTAAAKCLAERPRRARSPPALPASATAADGDPPTSWNDRSAEVKRRTKVIGRFPGETSCLTLVWAVLDIYLTHAKNGVRFNQLERQRLLRMRYTDSDTNHRRGGDSRIDSPHQEPKPRRIYSSKESAPRVGGGRWI